MSNKIHYKNYRELRERGCKEKGKLFLYEFFNRLNTRGYMNKKPPSLITGLKQKIALLSEKTNHQIVKQYVCISNNEHLKTMGAVALVAMLFVPEIGLAADNVDAFKSMFDKIAGWITGSAGKLITVIAIAVAAFIGVLGFSMKYVLGSFGVGLLLAFSVSIVNMLFAV
ncbi:hypothetical protein NF27_IP00180 [Candidatus Jidaibacter acanthamoeba]|uniref:Uncharacterized protein n=1 Tax=Candidatus Jidaibacter acanthamoebae TaxID=86105 RepID=A0A0C1QW74_9RICK|nr:TrbC/VirB2 family protein [Candidatus Jidaibacter acanthamoeba]KIE04250.1 hypothetical protein NF27_IP00180 [Candidatus Jidaibacter acanthamoeba]